MKTKKDIAKILFFSIVLISAFIFIYLYTSPSRCVSSDINQSIRNLFSSNKDYDMCINYYGATIFKSPSKAMLRARDDFGHIIVSLQIQYDLKTISDTNYNDYFKYASRINSTDESIMKEASGFTSFLDIYDNGLKRAKISLGCIFIKTFRVVDTLSDSSDTYPYVILENPDTKELMMVKVSLSLKEQFEEDKSYYIYFKNEEGFNHSYNDYELLFKDLLIVKAEEVLNSDDYIQENGCK